MPGVRNHTPGQIRYFTYYLTFPDGETWCDQTPFVHELQFQLQNTNFRHDPAKCRDLLQKGETSWTDHNGVKHRVVIDEEKRERVWGKAKPVVLRKKKRR